MNDGGDPEKEAEHDGDQHVHVAIRVGVDEDCQRL